MALRHERIQRASTIGSNLKDGGPRRRWAAMLVLTSALAAPGLAFAQDDGALDIVVTAQKRSERLQEVPIAITALSADALDNAGATNFSGVVNMTPTLNSVPYVTNSDTLVLTMRGQGEADADKITKDGSVGIYVDGFHRSRAQGALFDLADVERVEVLRGPQGTLYGRNTTGGAVNIISKKPSGELGGKAQLTYGNRDYVRLLTSLDLPAWNNLSAKFSFLYSEKDGYVKNIGPSNDYGELGNLAGRVALRWDAGTGFVADYQFDKGRTRSTPPYYVNPSLVGVVPDYSDDPYQTYRPVDLPVSKTDYDNHGLTLSWDASDLVTLKSLTGYRELKAHSFTDLTVALGLPTFPYNIDQERRLKNREFTQEFQLVGHSGDGRLEYTIGLFYLDERGSNALFQNLTLPFGMGTVVTDRRVRATSESKAAFAQLTWTPPVLDDRLELTFGGRYTDDKKTAARSIVVNGFAAETDIRNRQTFNRFNPAFTANMKWTQDLTTYAKFSTGYRAGGSSEGGGDFTLTYGPEKITSYEVGLKSQWLDSHLLFNLAAYHNKIKGLQIDIPVDAFDPSIVDTQNIGSGTIQGLEVELIARPVRDVSLTASYALVDTKVDTLLVPIGSAFDPAVNPGSPFAVGQNIADRFVIPFASRNTLTLSGDATFLRVGDNSFSAHADFRYQSGFYGAAGAGPAVPGREFYHAPSRETVNGRITWARALEGGSEMRVSLWGQNIFDTRNKQFIIAQGDTINGFVSQAAPYSEPATYGVELGFKF